MLWLARVEIIAGKLKHRLANVECIGVCGELFAEQDCHSVPSEAHPEPAAHELPLIVVVDRAPRAAQVNGYDREIGAFDDALVSVFEGARGAGACYAALGEDAEQVSVVERLAGSTQRLGDLARG